MLLERKPNGGKEKGKCDIENLALRQTTGETGAEKNTKYQAFAKPHYTHQTPNQTKPNQTRDTRRESKGIQTMKPKLKRNTETETDGDRNMGYGKFGNWDVWKVVVRKLLLTVVMRCEMYPVP